MMSVLEHVPSFSIVNLKHTSVFSEFEATKHLGVTAEKPGVLNGLLASGLYLTARKL